MKSLYLADDKSQLSSKFMTLFVASLFYISSGQVAGVQATEPKVVPPGGGGSETIGQRQRQNQIQSQNQIQDQNQTQRQGDNRVDVDGDDNDYFALAIPNLVAANCAGQSYSLGAGAAGFGFGLGQAQIDENCQIAKAIATAHLLQKTGLIELESYEYRKALCQMHGMEHVCNPKKRKKPEGKDPYCVGETTSVAYPGWCKTRIARDRRASKWSDWNLHQCGLERASFERDIENWGSGVYCVPHPKPEEPPIPYQPVLEPPVDTYGDKTTTYVTVRTGKHCGYDRVVFDWPKRVKYGVERRDDKVIVKFDRAEEIDVSSVSRFLGRHIKDAYAEEDAYGGTSVTLTVDDGVDHAVWRLGRRVIVDAKKPGCISG